MKRVKRKVKRGIAGNPAYRSAIARAKKIDMQSARSRGSEKRALGPLDVYDELRKAHLIIRSLYRQVTEQDKSDQNLDSFLVSAVETVNGVLYLAEAEAVRAENEE